MDSLRTLITQYLRAAWRRRWTGVIVAWLTCGVGWVGVYMIPNTSNPVPACSSMPTPS